MVSQTFCLLTFQSSFKHSQPCKVENEKLDSISWLDFVNLSSLCSPYNLCSLFCILHPVLISIYDIWLNWAERCRPSTNKSYKMSFSVLEMPASTAVISLMAVDELWQVWQSDSLTTVKLTITTGRASDQFWKAVIVFSSWNFSNKSDQF